MSDRIPVKYEGQFVDILDAATSHGGKIWWFDDCGISAGVER